jgi:hypothetical protein
MTSSEAWLAEPNHAVSDAALDTLLREAHTTRKWLDKPVSPALLMAIYDLMRWGPTAANITPAASRCRQCTPDDGGAGHSHPRL